MPTDNHVIPHRVRRVSHSGGSLKSEKTQPLLAQSPPTRHNHPFSSASFLTSTSAQQRTSPRHARAIVGGVVDARAIIYASLCGPGESLNSRSPKPRSQFKGVELSRTKHSDSKTLLSLHIRYSISTALPCRQQLNITIMQI